VVDWLAADEIVGPQRRVGTQLAGRKPTSVDPALTMTDADILAHPPTTTSWPESKAETYPRSRQPRVSTDRCCDPGRNHSPDPIVGRRPTRPEPDW
jgi:hypothetical protein